MNRVTFPGSNPPWTWRCQIQRVAPTPPLTELQTVPSGSLQLLLLTCRLTFCLRDIVPTWLKPNTHHIITDYSWIAVQRSCQDAGSVHRRGLAGRLLWCGSLVVVLPFSLPHPFAALLPSFWNLDTHPEWIGRTRRLRRADAFNLKRSRRDFREFKLSRFKRCISDQIYS